ncbi:MAG: undecaprenyl-diphosphatase UppP [Thermodesulfobacteriota bacterium]
MSLLHAILLGLIQGATEFLPISSSGHLALAHYFFGVTEAGLAFDVGLHLGTLVAIVVYFRDDLLTMAAALLPPNRQNGGHRHHRRLFWFLAAATIPGVIAGLLLEEAAETSLRHPAMVAATLSAAGLLLLIADRNGGRSRSFDTLTLKDALIIGCSQALAIVPGVSRSGITITAGLFRHLDRQAAVRFSFLLSAPIIFGAGIYKIPEIVTNGLLTDHLAAYVAGFAAAAFSGYLFIAFLMRFVRARSFAIFAYYRFGLSAVVLLALLLTA